MREVRDIWIRCSKTPGILPLKKLTRTTNASVPEVNTFPFVYPIVEQRGILYINSLALSNDPGSYRFKSDLGGIVGRCKDIRLPLSVPHLVGSVGLRTHCVSGDLSV